MDKGKVDGKVIDLYNEYIHTSLSRQDFLARLTRLAGGADAAKLAWSRTIAFWDNYLKT
ncbi:MAG: hypothetical protein K2P94_16420 [Rhodospirillaceae bacterium]|nr:hypothetical protein [Rhodospirillaceae bacterium]